MGKPPPPPSDQQAGNGVGSQVSPRKKTLVLAGGCPHTGVKVELLRKSEGGKRKMEDRAPEWGEGRGVWVFGCLDVWVFGCWGVQMYRCAGV